MSACGQGAVWTGTVQGESEVRHEIGLEWVSGKSDPEPERVRIMNLGSQPADQREES